MRLKSNEVYLNRASNRKLLLLVILFLRHIITTTCLLALTLNSLNIIRPNRKHNKAG